VEKVLARLASRAHGIVTRAELLDAGVSDGEIEHRIRTGALIRQHRGVYRVGHRAPSTEATYLAAVRACGVGAVLSGLAAAHLHGLIKGRAPEPEVTAPNDRRVEGLRTTRARRGPIETTRVHGIPVTTVARTLVDIAGRLFEDELARACHEAGVRYRTTPRQVQAVLERRPRSPGARTLWRIMAGDVKVSLSGLEKRFLQVLREAGLPLPITNRRAGVRRVDCRWPEHALTVELDSYRFHNTRYAWEQDRRREREAHSRGDEFRRYTHDDVFERPGPMLRELTALVSGTRRARAA
jgi:hypothetical protein